MSPGSYLRKDKLTRMIKHPPPLLNRQYLKGAGKQAIGDKKTSRKHPAEVPFISVQLCISFVVCNECQYAGQGNSLTCGGRFLSDQEMGMDLVWEKARKHET